MKHFYYQLSHFKMHNLTPLLLYTLSVIFLVIAALILEPAELTRYLYIVTGLNTTVWLFSMVVLNRNASFYKDSIVKVSYMPIFYRMMPTILFQTFVFVMMLVLGMALIALTVDDWLVNIFTLLYYILLGMLLIIPFVLLYLVVNAPSDRFNTIIFIILVLVVPVLYLPENLPEVLTNILSLNPFYYVVNGLQSNSINLAWGVHRLPHDILFFSQIGLIYLWMFKFYAKMKFDVYNFN